MDEVGWQDFIPRWIPLMGVTRIFIRYFEESSGRVPKMHSQNLPGGTADVSLEKKYYSAIRFLE